MHAAVFVAGLAVFAFGSDTNDHMFAWDVHVQSVAVSPAISSQGAVGGAPSSESSLYHGFPPLNQYDFEDDNDVSEWDRRVEQWRKQIKTIGRVRIGSARLIQSDYHARLHRLPMQIVWDKGIDGDLWAPWLSLSAEDARSLREKAGEGQVTAEVRIGRRGDRGEKDDLVLLNPRLEIAGQSLPIYNRSLREFYLDGEPSAKKSIGSIGTVRSTAISADGRRVLLSWGGESGALLLDADTGKRLHRFTGNQYAQNPAVLSGNGRRVLVGTVLWDAETGTQLRTLTKDGNHEIECVSLSADGRLALAVTGTHKTILWDTETGKQVQVFDWHGGHNGPIAWAALSADGTRMLTGHWRQTAVLWNTKTGDSLRSFGGPHALRLASLVDHEALGAAALSSDGRFAVTASEDGTASVWNAESGARLHSLQGKAKHCSVALTSDGSRILTSAGSAHAQYLEQLGARKDEVCDTATLWDAPTGRQLLSFRSPKGRLPTVAISADGRRVLTGVQDRQTGRNNGTVAVLWDAEY